MNKKIIAVLIALLSSASIGTATLAKKISVTAFEPPYPIQQYPEVTFAEGVAFDKETKESKQVVFLMMEYDSKKNIYLIVEDQTYKMTEITNATYNLGPGTKVFQYKSEDGSILTVLVQRFEQLGQVSISGDFKNYLITFKSMYYYEYPRPLYGEMIREKNRIRESQSELPGLGAVAKEMRKDVIEETRPVGLKKLANIEGIDIEKLLENSAKPLPEWFG